MKIIETAEQAAVITANDLRAEALEALTEGNLPLYHRNTNGQLVEVLVLGLRAGVAHGADAQWGDIETGAEGEQVIVLDSGQRYTLDGKAIAHTPVTDGREDALTFAAEHPDEVAEVIERWGTSLGPDEALLNAMGVDWVCRRWGVDPREEEFYEACLDYNRAYLHALEGYTLGTKYSAKEGES